MTKGKPFGLLPRTQIWGLVLCVYEGQPEFLERSGFPKSMPAEGTRSFRPNLPTSV